MPGHSVAALTSYPKLGCVGTVYQVRTSWGVAEDVLCAGKERTYDYVDSVLSEVVDLFPSEYIRRRRMSQNPVGVLPALPSRDPARRLNRRA
jgi:hypothetical protein